jgi:uncharacterized OB-fold protein
MTASPAPTFGEWIHRPFLQTVTTDMAPFWEGVSSHELRLCRCSRCRAWYFPFTLCTRHADIPDLGEMRWQVASGRGAIFTYVVVHRVVDPAFEAELPYILAIVELDEGPLFPARVINVEPGDALVGTEVQASYLDVPAAQTLILFSAAG